MRQLSSPGSMQRLARAWRREGVSIGFVPTMGYLHAGHLSLLRRARALVGAEGRVVVSIYVNPAQFAPTEDQAKYPRDLPRDLRLCREAGADAVFTPDDAAMYPRRGVGWYSTYVVEESLARGMEGGSRPTHFRGVTTVVAKLFNLVLPDVAVFGAKDWQQAAVIRRMAADLNFPLRVVVAATVREADGVAMSSRNKFLTPAQRAQATVLWRSLCRARELAAAEETLGAERLRAEVATLVARESEARLDYVEVFDPETLVPVTEVRRGTHLALAVFIGSTRLIDNGRL